MASTPRRPLRRAYVALGANLGDRLAAFEQALTHLARTPGVHVAAVSPVYEAEAHTLDGQPQPPYLNAVAALDTRLAAADLLQRLQAIEQTIGRDPQAPRWSPRVLDLDLLLLGTERVATDLATVPHPRLAERRFVLQPLADLAPTALVPQPDGTTVEVQHLLRACTDRAALNRTTYVLTGLVPTPTDRRPTRPPSTPSAPNSPLTDRPSSPPMAASPAADLPPSTEPTPASTTASTPASASASTPNAGTVSLADPAAAFTWPDRLRYIAIEGVIGAGKTTLARMLAERTGARLVLEQFEENPFLARFYEDPDRWAFQTQLNFLASRFRQQKALQSRDLFQQLTVADYTFDKDRIFAHLTLRGDERALYDSLHALMEPTVTQPDLVVYLQSSLDRLMHNIARRGRAYERNMDRAYIAELAEAYDRHFFHYQRGPLLILNVAQIDFVGNPDQFDELVRQIATTRGAGTTYFRAPATDDRWSMFG